jgi:hypothetical protein
VHWMVERLRMRSAVFRSTTFFESLEDGEVKDLVYDEAYLAAFEDVPAVADEGISAARAVNAAGGLSGAS